MTSREQIAAALKRLDARDREVLDLSLRRRVPDDALGDLYDWKPGEVAQRRAAAIEMLSSALGVQRGAELGDVLKALLEQDTWELVQDGATEAPSEEPEEESEVAPKPEPGPAEAKAEPTQRRGGGPARAMRIGAVAVLAAAGAGVLAAALLDGDVGGPPGASINQTRPFVPAGGKGATGAKAAPFPTDAQAASGYPTAYVRRAMVLRRSPGGKPLVKIPRRTEWGSPRVLGVVRRKGNWLAVVAPELRNGQVGWIRAESAQLDGAPYSVSVDRSRRAVVVRKAGRSVRRFTVAVGRAGHPTPLGRYAVTDKLNVKQKGSPYGCCVVALTGHQTRLPPDWPGGDRLAIHATTDLASIGRPASLGCMRTTSRQARYLVKTLPIGSPVFVKR